MPKPTVPNPGPQKRGSSTANLPARPPHRPLLPLTDIELAKLDPDVAIRVVEAQMEIDRNNSRYDMASLSWGGATAVVAIAAFVALTKWGFPKSAYVPMITQLLGIVTRFINNRR